MLVGAPSGAIGRGLRSGLTIAAPIRRLSDLSFSFGERRRNLTPSQVACKD